MPTMFKVQPRDAQFVHLRDRRFEKGKPQLLTEEEVAKYSSGDLTYTKVEVEAPKKTTSKPVDKEDTSEEKPAPKASEKSVAKSATKKAVVKAAKKKK